MVCSGPSAPDFVTAVESLGFGFRAIESSVIGDSSRIKLMRSIFAKGLEALMIESALAAEAFGLSEELLRQFDHFDMMPTRDHLDMYLRTHLRHAERRSVEMCAAEAQLLSVGLPSVTTRAAIERYQHTLSLLEKAGEPDQSIRDNATSAMRWLLAQETV
jgi:hypothetical protein